MHERGGLLAAALAAVPEIAVRFDRAAIERLTDPTNYPGAAPRMVDRVLASAPREH